MRRILRRIPFRLIGFVLLAALAGLFRGQVDVFRLARKDYEKGPSNPKMRKYEGYHF